MELGPVRGLLLMALALQLANQASFLAPDSHLVRLLTDCAAHGLKPSNLVASTTAGASSTCTAHHHQHRVQLQGLVGGLPSCILACCLEPSPLHSICTCTHFCWQTLIMIIINKPQCADNICLFCLIHAGYTSAPAPTSVCQANGTWTSPTTVCHKGVPPDPPYGFWSSGEHGTGCMHARPTIDSSRPCPAT